MKILILGFFLRFCLMMSLHLSDTDFEERAVVPLYPPRIGSRTPSTSGIPDSEGAQVHFRKRA